MDNDLNLTRGCVGMDRLKISGGENGDWYIAFSAESQFSAEGTWDDWLLLARTIIQVDEIYHLTETSPQCD